MAIGYRKTSFLLLIVVQVAEVYTSTPQSATSNVHERHSFNRQMENSTGSQLPDTSQDHATPTNNFIIFAFRDATKHIIKLYVEVERPLVSATIAGNQSHRIAQCSFHGSSREHDRSQHKLEAGYSWFPFDGHDLPGKTVILGGTVDCPDPGAWATSVQIASETGAPLSLEVEIETIETQHHGRVASCSQPLHTSRHWLQDWVKHNEALGISKIYMHAPVGPHVDALFNDQREQRVRRASELAERSPEILGTEPLRKFEHPIVEWHEYRASPDADYYSEMWIFQSCLWRGRYAYDYMMFLDIDEFFTIHHSNPLAGRPMHEFLDAHMPQNVASLSFAQMTFPLHCAIKHTGKYADRFNLRFKEPNQWKAIERPHAVNLTHIHGVLSVQEEFWGDQERSSIPDHNPNTKEIYHTAAFMKHIQPRGSVDKGPEREFPCAFGYTAKNVWNFDSFVLHQ